MKRSVLFVLLTFLLVFTSVLVPCPDFLSKVGNFTGDGLQVASAADLSAVTVSSTPTTDNAVSNTNQRKTFYGASRFWVFYSDGTDLTYKSSLDGITWTSANVVRGCTDGYKFSIWWDGTYIHYTYATGIANTALIYRRGTPDTDGTISWSNEANAVAADASKTYLYPFISKDTSGYPVISYTCDNTTVTTPYATKSNQSDGTWTTCNFTTQLSTTDDDSWRTAILPVASQDLMAVYARDTNFICSKVFDFSGDTFLSENTTDSAIEVGYAFSAVVTSDYVTHLVFEYTDDDIVYTHYHSGGTDWEAEENVPSLPTK